MLKLYYKPLACSLAVHIALRELGLPFELVRVANEGSVRQAAGDDYYQIHALGTVPALRLENRTVMSETAVILEYLATRAASPSLAPVARDPEYWAFRQLMNFIATDIHKNYGPLFYPGTPEDMKNAWLKRLEKRLVYLSANLASRPYLLARGYSVADIYLFVMLFWCSYVGVDIKRQPIWARYHGTLVERLAIRQALEIEQG